MIHVPHAVVKLKHPIADGPRLITEISFRRARLADLEGLPSAASGEEKTLHMLSKMSGLSRAVISQIDLADMAAIGEVIGRLL